ncbi:MAG TPA: hypothetical protein P5555_10875 [Candidatus Paceibacterota bacterium]|nr:hypothetical protein [Verrucomicrobiota bacterium]HOX02929.1 hypothetical protein [Verrucomicrobiota bacterium]HRZ45681.1 hypothetical protein [Candidatus Paceibacterota bacterium]
MPIGLAWMLAWAAGGADLAWNWANPRPMGSHVFDLFSTNGWYFAVSERGRLYASLDLDLWAVRETGTSKALRAMGQLGSRLIVTGEAGTVLYAEGPTNRFQAINLGTEDWLEAIAVSAELGLAVAVGDRGAIYASGDGIQWQRQTAPFNDWLRGVAFGNHLFVAVGEDGSMASSTDGRSWWALTRRVATHLNRVSWLGDRFWAVGDAGVVLTSTTGSSWTALGGVGITNNLHAVAGDSTVRWLIGDGGLWRGERSGAQYVWSSETSASKTMPAPAWTYYSALWDGGNILAGGRTGMLVAGGRASAWADFDWLTLSDSVYAWLWDVIRRDGRYVAVGDKAVVQTSDDGAEWDLESVPPEATNSVFLGIGQGPAGLLAAGTHGTMIYSPDQWTNVVTETVVIDGGTAITNRVTNAVNLVGWIWDAVGPRPTTNDLQGVMAWNGQWFVCGGQGALLRSPDLAAWTPLSTGTGAFLSSMAAFPGGAVAVGDGGAILHSNDGERWAPRDSGTTNWLYRVRWIRDQLVAVGENGTILTSSDGVAWVTQTSGVSQWLNDVLRLEDRLVAVGSQGVVLQSPDAIRWTRAENITLKSLFALAGEPHQLVAVGVEGAILRCQTAPAQILDYRFDNGPGQGGSATNRLLVSGSPGQAFTAEKGGDLGAWQPGPTNVFLDNTGLMRIQETEEDRLPTRFRRARSLPEG